MIFLVDQTNIAKKLIEHGANVNLKRDDDKTPLHIAAQYGKFVQKSLFSFNRLKKQNCSNKILQVEMK